MLIKALAVFMCIQMSVAGIYVDIISSAIIVTCIPENHYAVHNWTIKTTGFTIFISDTLIDRQYPIKTVILFYP